MPSAELIALFDRLKDAPRRLFFPGALPDRNALDEAQRRYVQTPWGRVPEYAALKRRLQSELVMFGRRIRWEPTDGRVIVACNWREADRRRDPDNVVSGGKKLVLDALKPTKRGRGISEGLGLIHCDGWHCIAGFVDIVTHDPKSPGVEVVIAEVQLSLPLSLQAVR